MTYETPIFRPLPTTLEMAGCTPCLGVEQLGRCPAPPSPGLPCITARGETVAASICLTSPQG